MPATIRLIIILLITFLNSIYNTSWAQSQEEINQVSEEILEDGRQLYHLEQASWVGTDWLMSTQADRSSLGGYFSYLEGDSVRCIFFLRPENGQPLRVHYTYSFPHQEFSVTAGRAQDQVRLVTNHEQQLFAIRAQAQQEMQEHRLLGQPYQVPDNANLNMVILEKETGAQVYLIVGTQENNTIPIGGDYLLSFTASGQLRQAKKLHNSYLGLKIPAGYNEVSAMVHTHVEGLPYITPTDICSLLLYQQQVPVKQHLVLGKKLVSIFSIPKQQLTIITRKAWDKMQADQATKSK